MSKSHAELLHAQVDDFLRAALSERDDARRAKLLAKAVHWHEAVEEAARAETAPAGARRGNGADAPEA